MAHKHKPSLVITGATGFVGNYLVEYFSAKGWHVTALGHQTAALPSRPGVRYLAYDIAASPDESAFVKADYLIHLAYVKKSDKNPDAFQVNIDGAKRLLAVSRKHKLKKNIFMSSMSAQPDALSSYGQQKFRIEKLFRGKQDVVVRSGLVIGDGGLLKQTVTFMRTKHAAPLIDGGHQPLQIIAVYDLARIMETMLTGRLAGTFTVANPTFYDYRSLYKTITDRLGIRVIFIPVPSIVPHMILRTIQFLHLPFPVNDDNLLGLKRLRYVDTAQDLKRIGVTVDSLEEALAKLDLKAS